MSGSSAGSSSGGTDTEPGLTDTERAVYGPQSLVELQSFLDGYARFRLRSPIVDVRFRAGRIDAVWGVELADGRAVVIKGHRGPADTAAITAAVDAQRILSGADFPCPEPLSGPDEIGGRVLTAEVLLTGEVPDGRDPATRRLLAEGLVQHIDLLRGRPDLVERAGSGPSWCRYQAGPWPVPHDPIVDFRVTPPGYGWLDAHGQRAADQVLACRDGAEVVVGHADWYAGNTVVADGGLVGSFDWELVADAEAVIAGFTAACFGASPTSGGGLSTPEEVALFLQDYDAARGVAFSRREQQSAAGAAAWIIAFNARWELGMSNGVGEDGASLSLARHRGDEYLDLAW